MCSCCTSNRVQQTGKCQLRECCALDTGKTREPLIVLRPSREVMRRKASRYVARQRLDERLGAECTGICKKRPPFGREYWVVNAKRRIQVRDVKISDPFEAAN